MFIYLIKNKKIKNNNNKFGIAVTIWGWLAILFGHATSIWPDWGGEPDDFYKSNLVN
jgi:hypothetical protein